MSERGQDIDSKSVGSKLKKQDRLRLYQKSLLIGERVWKTAPTNQSASERHSAGHMFEDSFQNHVHALKRSRTNHGAKFTPFNEKRDAAAAFNQSGYSCETLDAVMEGLMKNAKRPNTKQERFLRHFVKRLKFEWVEKHRGDINSAKGEPLLDLVHGFPGTGKSAVIAWMRKLMEEGLGWVHGVQFVCLAFQNAMAAQINGHTIHHWTGLPARTDDAAAYGDKHKMSQKCGALRVMIIDEASTSVTKHTDPRSTTPLL